MTTGSTKENMVTINYKDYIEISKVTSFKLNESAYIFEEFQVNHNDVGVGFKYDKVWVIEKVINESNEKKLNYRITLFINVTP